MKKSYNQLFSVLVEVAGAAGKHKKTVLGDPVTNPQRAFALGSKMADREAKRPELGKKHKASRERLKTAGFRSVSAGMADRMRHLRKEGKVK